jgi:uncharacterized protein involved in exopolysaccharide biosynthesis
MKKNKFEDFLIILIKHRKLIVLNVLIITLLAVAVSFIIPKKYTAVASVIPPKKKGGLFGDITGFSSTLKDITKTIGGRLGNVSDEAYNYLVILQSRTASEKVIEKFNLRSRYNFDYDDPFEDVLKELQSNVDFTIEDEGNLLISVSDKVPDSSAMIANYYVEILNNLSTELSIIEAKNNREFIEKRLDQVKADLASIEDSLKIFSKKKKVLAIDEQIKGAINVAAELNAQLELAKIERDILSSSLGVDNPLVLQAKIKIEELQKRLEGLNFGDNRNLRSSVNFFIPFENVPETGIQYIRLMRDLEIQTKLMEFIFPIYEQAKIEEQKSTPVVLVLDKAISPERKSSPKRMIIIAAAFVLSLFFSIGFALFKESYSEIKKDETRYNKIRNGIILPLKNIFRSNKKSS